MTLSDFILQKGQIMLKQTTIEDVFVNNSPLICGTIEKVNDLSDLFSDWEIITQKVLFNPSESITIIFNDEIYFLTKESSISLDFTILTPP
jgi:hypothetical protein